jgi:hypothetical protein
MVVFHIDVLLMVVFPAGDWGESAFLFVKFVHTEHADWPCAMSHKFHDSSLDGADLLSMILDGADPSMK